MSENLNTIVSFPTTMQWFGTFDNTLQYIKNDVVIDSNDKATYLCTATSASIGVDPSLSQDWYLFTGTVSGIHTVDVIGGLSNVGTATQPTIQNDGVRTVVAGSNVFLSGTPQNRVINSIGINAFTAGLGISVLGNEITNSGIRTIGTGGGVYLETPPPNAKISMSNILSVTAGAGLSNIGTAQNPIIENEGVRSLSLVDIQNTGTSQDALLSNAGVISLVNTDGSLQITGSSSVTVSCLTSPQTIKLGSYLTMVPSNWPTNWPVIPTLYATLSFTPASSLLTNSITNGIPAFITVNLNSICIRVSGAITVLNERGVILALDSTTSTSVVVGTIGISNSITAIYPFDMSFGTISFNSSLLTNAGLKTITGFAFLPSVNGQIWNLLSYGDICGTWTKTL